MRQDQRVTTPTSTNLLGRAAGERHEGVDARDQHIELLVVQGPVLVVRVAKVVHGVDRRNALRTDGVQHLPQRLRLPGVEAELEMEHVQVVGLQPRGTEHHRRPPGLLGRAARGRRVGIRQPAHRAARLGGDVPDVDVGRGNRGHGHPGHRRARLCRGHHPCGHREATLPKRSLSVPPLQRNHARAIGGTPGRTSPRRAGSRAPGARYPFGRTRHTADGVVGTALTSHHQGRTDDQHTDGY